MPSSHSARASASSGERLTEPSSSAWRTSAFRLRDMQRNTAERRSSILRRLAQALLAATMRAVAYPSMAAAPVRRRHEAGCSATIVRTSSAIAATEPNPTAPAMVTSRSMFSFAALSVLFIFDSLPRRFPWVSFSHSPSRSCSASASASCAADGRPAPVAPRVPYRPHSAGPAARRGRTPYFRPTWCRRRLGGAAAPLPLAGERPPAAPLGAALRQGIGSYE
nr:MAG TPA: hypothetical protein [Caudoviricetes sp.]